MSEEGEVGNGEVTVSVSSEPVWNWPPEYKQEKLLAALSKAQSEFTNVPKTKLNPHFKSKYADLTDITDMFRPILSKHGLTLFHRTTFREYGSHFAGWVLETILAHTSGERMMTFLPIKGQTPQAIGSEMTYMRRYGACCLLGIVSDDDEDGASPPPPRPDAPKSTATRKKKATRTKASAPPPDPKSKAGDGTEPLHRSSKVLWPLVYETGGVLGMDKQDTTAWFRKRLKEWTGLESTKDMTQPQANDVIARLQKVLDDNTPPEGDV